MSQISLYQSVAELQSYIEEIKDSTDMQDGIYVDLSNKVMAIHNAIEERGDFVKLWYNEVSLGENPNCYFPGISVKTAFLVLTNEEFYKGHDTNDIKNVLRHNTPLRRDKYHEIKNRIGSYDWNYQFCSPCLGDEAIVDERGYSIFKVSMM